MDQNGILNNNPFRQTSISLWGPTAAGKDWLIRAFAKELELYNRRRGIDYQYTLEDLFDPQNPNPVIAEPPINIGASVTFEDFHYLFKRTPIIPDNKRFRVTYEHDIVIHNDAGINLTECLIDQNTFDRTYFTLISPRNILLILAIPDEDKNTQINHNILNDDTIDISTIASLQQSNASIWTKTTYLVYLRRLFNSLDRERGKKNIAVCLTKWDLQPYIGDPWSVLQRRFDNSIVNFLRQKQQIHNIEVFVTSAVGFRREGNSFVANYQGGTIPETNRWNPINCASPFYWIFEQIERALLPPKRLVGPDPQMVYPSYPRPR